MTIKPKLIEFVEGRWINPASIIAAEVSSTYGDDFDLNIQLVGGGSMYFAGNHYKKEKIEKMCRLIGIDFPNEE